MVATNGLGRIVALGQGIDGVMMQNEYSMSLQYWEPDVGAVTIMTRSSTAAWGQLVSLAQEIIGAK